MRIDAHQHFWKYNAEEYGWIDESMAALRRDFLPNDLQRELEPAGFQGCVAVQVRQSLAESEWLLELARKWPFIAGVVGWVDLRSPKVHTQLEILAKQPKFAGVRHIVQSEPDERFLLQPEFVRGFSLLRKFNLSYDLLIYERHLPAAIEFVRRAPEQRIVLDHLAKPRIRERIRQPWARQIRELSSFPNVYCKLSGMVTEADWGRWSGEEIRPYLDVAFECFGADRLMIGSDWPVCTVAGSYARTVDVVKSYVANCIGEVREKVLGANAQRFYGLQEGAADCAADHVKA